MKKQAFYKVYSPSMVYITTWQADVASIPIFPWNTNGSLGNMQIKLARPLNDFGEGHDVSQFNVIETWIKDKENPAGLKIHTGILSTYNLNLQEDGGQYIIVDVISFTFFAQMLVAKDGDGKTTLSFTSEEPAQIMRDLIDLMANEFGYTIDTIEDTGTTVSYEFQYITFLDAIKKIIELCPAYWYWYVDQDNNFHLHQTDFNVIDHHLFIGKHVKAMQFKKTVENIVNAVYFLGKEVAGENLYRKYESTGSIDSISRRLELLKQDTRVDVVGTAQAISQKILDEQDHFEQELTITVVDSNVDTLSGTGATSGYDIESIKPGDVVIIQDPKSPVQETTFWDDAETVGNGIFDESFWDYDIRFSLGIPMQVLSINYQFHKAELTVSTRLPDIPKRIEDINRNLVVEQSTLVPDEPV